MDTKFRNLSDEETLSSFRNTIDMNVIGQTVKESVEETEKKISVLQSLKKLNISLTRASKKVRPKKGKKCLRKINLTVSLARLLKEKELNRTIKMAQSYLSDVLTK
ncbi:hypothetical protein TNCV_3695691 [Trichonephila clavipes]|nr:hypothetical protein TNCV_3695691 [Trichonephila clavipes]